MADARIRRQIALLAARLMYDRQESEYFTAKRKAARQLGVEYRYRPKDLPSNREIRVEDHMDRWELFRLLLEPLERVRQNPQHHPEGDALYHSLQVFELARAHRPWDEEFLLAALLHDIGKAIDPGDHVAAGLQSLEGVITERTQFLIAHHMDALAYVARELGHRARLRLEASDEFDDLMLLRELDTAGRQRGVQVCTVQEALDHIQSLEGEYG